MGWGWVRHCFGSVSFGEVGGGCRRSKMQDDVWWLGAV